MSTRVTRDPALIDGRYCRSRLRPRRYYPSQRGSRRGAAVVLSPRCMNAATAAVIDDDGVKCLCEVHLKRDYRELLK